MGLTVADLDAKLTLDDRGFNQGLTAADRRIERTGSSLRQTGERMAGFGDRMTRSVSLPLVGIGVAALKTSVDFDSAMSRIVGLVGVASDEVDGMREDVLKLSGETAKSPQELADALFTITSAGLRGSDAMDVLEMSAKASAAGLGETRAIAEAVTAAINTYGADVIDAARATDILVATAQAGNFATEDLAGALGRVLPFAKAAGGSFEDIGGTVALLTRQNNDANESITQTTALFRSFVKPSQQAIDVLKGVGLTTDQVRESMGERGLVATLQMLDKRLGGNREQLGKIIEDSSGFAAAINILDADAETLAGTFGTVEDSAGLLDNAFGAFAESAGFTAQQAFAELQVALIKVGDIIVPVASKVLGFAGDMLSAFSDLPDPILQTVVALGGLVAAIFPLLSVGGRLLQWFDDMRSKALNWRDTLSKLDPRLIALAAAIAIATFALTQHNRKKEEAKRRTEEYLDVLRLEQDEQAKARAEMAATSPELERLRSLTDDLGISMGDAMGLIEDQADAISDWRDAIQSMPGGSAVQPVIDALREAAGEGDQVAAMLLEVAESSGPYRDTVLQLAIALDEQADASERAKDQHGEEKAVKEELTPVTDQLTEAEQGLADAVNEVAQSLDELLARFFSVEEAMRAEQEALAVLRENVKEHGVTLDIATEAGRRNQENLQALVESHAGLGEALLETGASEEDLQGKMAVSRAALIEEARQAGFSEEAVRRLSNQIDDVDELVQTEFDAQVDPARSQVDDLRSKLDAILPRYSTKIQVETERLGPFIPTHPDFGNFRQHGGPARAGVPYVVGERRAELFVPGVDGQILPRVPSSIDELMSMMPGSMTPSAPVMGASSAPAATLGRIDATLRIVGSGGLYEAVQKGVRDGQIQMQVDGRPVRVPG